jgi:phospholipase C
VVISPWSRVNFVDHTLIDQSSVIRFVEDNWTLGRIGDGSFDELAWPLTGMFDFRKPNAKRSSWTARRARPFTARARATAPRTDVSSRG